MQGKLGMNDLVRGYVEHLEHNTVIGWACDLGNPEKSVRVQARFNGESVEEVVADIPRNDLLEAGIGTGRHGFRITVTPDLYRLLLEGSAEIWAASAATSCWRRLPARRQGEQEAGFIKRIRSAASRIRKTAIAAQGGSKMQAPSTILPGGTMGSSAKVSQAGQVPVLDASGRQDESSITENLQGEERSLPTPFEVSGKLFGFIDVLETDKLSGWMLATRNQTTPVLTIDGLPTNRSEWPLPRKDVALEYGLDRRTGFHFSFDPAPCAKAELYGFDGRKLMKASTYDLPSAGQSSGTSMFRRLMADAAKSDAVAVTCWDAAHNPIGRAKVLYDVLHDSRPVWLFSYLFEEFGGTLWEPIKDARLRIVAVPWKDRDHYHRLFELYGIKFSTVWMCKPRFPTLMMASAIAAADAKLILDFDDNEEYFSKSPASVGKPYGGDTIGLVRSLISDIKARTAASLSLAEDYETEIVRHARRPARKTPKRKNRFRDRPLRIGFIGTVRPHKRIVEAAQAIRVASHTLRREMAFCVYGDIRPDDYRLQLEANGAETHGTVVSSVLEATLQSFDLVLTGFPSQSVEDEPITRYQITSKIGDALANGIPALVPRSRSVEDLEGTPGVFLFDADDFPEVLMKAANYSMKIELPREFTTEGAYVGFAKAANSAPADSSALDGLRPPHFRECSKRSVILIWKQQDSGLYGRRVDQIARTIKLIDEEVTVRVVEFMNESLLSDLQRNAQDLTSEAAQILRLADLKQSGNLRSPEGVFYHQVLVKRDVDAAGGLVDLLWSNGHTPKNTLIIVFPAFSILSHLASVIDPFTLVSDIVDNQLTWGANGTKADLIAQYVWLMQKSRYVVFNSSANMAYFRTAGFLERVPDDRVSIVPNWYMAPLGVDVGRSDPLESKDGLVNVIYSGNLNDRIDWKLMERCAVASPQLRLHIVGDGSRVSDKLRALIENENVIYHGPLREEKVSRLLRKIHFAIMPHLKNEVSNFMNPLKILMYAAHGVSSVTLDVPGLNEINGLKVVKSPDAFVEQVLNWVKEVQQGTLFPPKVSTELPDFGGTYANLIRTCSAEHFEVTLDL